MSAFSEAWCGIGILKWPALALIVLGLFLTPLLGPQTPKWMDHEDKPLAAGGLIRVETKGVFRLGQRTTIRVYAEGIEANRVFVGFTGGDTREVAFEAQGGEAVAETEIRAPSTTDRFRISVSLEPDSGEELQAIWDLGRPLSF